MRALALLLPILLGCASQPADPIDPTLEITFDEVDLSHYSRPADQFIAIEPHARSNTEETIHWCLYANGAQVKCSSCSPCTIAGHRWYLARDANWTLRMLAWTPQRSSENAWTWPAEKETP